MKYLLALLLFAFSGFAADKIKSLGPVGDDAPEIIKKLWKHPEALKARNVAPEFFHEVMANLWAYGAAEEKANNKPLKKSAYRWAGNFQPKEGIHGLKPVFVGWLRLYIVDQYTKNYTKHEDKGAVLNFYKTVLKDFPIRHLVDVLGKPHKTTEFYIYYRIELEDTTTGGK